MHTDDAAAIETLQTLFQQQKRAYQQEMMPSYDVRIERLNQLEAMILQNQDKIAAALLADFGSHAPELTRITEVLGPVSRVRFAKKQLKKWMKPHKRPIDRLLFGMAKNELIYQPVGVVGNMSPWNFPIDISFGPLVDILAAGNRAIVKPSENAPHCAELIKQLISETFALDLVAVVTGGVELAQAFSKMPWDHLLFTGGPEIGKRVMAAAAENLTPVTLELGGKNPTIITADNLTLKTVMAIMATKMVKAGQMCITSDYVFVPADQINSFVSLAQEAMAKLYPKVINNGDSASIINAHHFERLQSYLEEARAKARVVELNPAGETADPAQRKLVPTLVLDPSDDLLVMKHEIFGPILPITPYSDMQDVIDYINGGERPLALYIFSKDKATIQRVIDNTISGGVAVNAVSLHAMQASLPFGGTGRSGTGHHHGFEGFVAFSKAKPVFTQAPVDGSSLLFPPYGRAVNRLLDFLLPR
ncbi:MAG: coniferyl aldehyde dehydrogenase [Chloroflexota bacterium]